MFVLSEIKYEITKENEVFGKLVICFYALPDQCYRRW
jgi:hypothetical protein